MYNPAIVEAFREVCTSTQLAGTDDVDGSAETAGTSDAVRTESGRSTPDDIDELQLALGLGAALSSLSDQEHPWRELSDALRRLPGVDTVAIFMVDEPQHRLVVTQTSGTHARRLEGFSMGMGDRISGWVAATGQPMINGEAGLDLFDVSATALRTAIAVPCSTPAGAKVVLTLYSTRPDAFSSLHHRLLAAAVSFVQSSGDQRRQDRELHHRCSPSAVAAAKETFRRARSGQQSTAVHRLTEQQGSNRSSATYQGAPPPGVRSARKRCRPDSARRCTMWPLILGKRKSQCETLSAGRLSNSSKGSKCSAS